jgi:hypothetical protein
MDKFHVRGANSIIALRYCHLNGRLEDYWEGRRAAGLGMRCDVRFACARMASRRLMRDCGVGAPEPNGI